MIRGKNPIDRIANLFGGQNAMGRALGVRQSVVWAWVQKNRVPSARIPAIIRAAADMTPPVALRADDFFDLPNTRGSANTAGDKMDAA